MNSVNRLNAVVLDAPALVAPNKRIVDHYYALLTFIFSVVFSLLCSWSTMLIRCGQALSFSTSLIEANGSSQISRCQRAMPTTSAHDCTKAVSNGLKYLLMRCSELPRGIQHCGRTWALYAYCKVMRRLFFRVVPAITKRIAEGKLNRPIAFIGEWFEKIESDVFWASASMPNDFSLRESTRLEMLILIFRERRTWAFHRIHSQSLTISLFHLF